MWKVFWAACAIFLIASAAVVGVFVVQFEREVHDKSASAEVGRLDFSPDPQLPFGVVVPAHNRWTKYAFIAQPIDAAQTRRPGEEQRALSLVLNDHYRGDDPDYGTASGVIGDDLSSTALCSIPAQAAQKQVIVDPVVNGLIQSRCGNVR